MTKWIKPTAAALANAGLVLWMALSFMGPVGGFRFGIVMPSLLFVVSLAVAGPGNRIVWCWVCVLISSVVDVLDRFGVWPSDAELTGVGAGGSAWLSGLYFASMPLVSGGVLWLAHRLRQWRAKPPASRSGS